MVPCGRPRLPTPRAFRWAFWRKKALFEFKNYLFKSQARTKKTWATPDERGESKLGSRQVSAVDGLHKAKQFKRKMMRQLFMQDTVMLRNVWKKSSLSTRISCTILFISCRYYSSSGAHNLSTYTVNWSNQISGDLHIRIPSTFSYLFGQGEECEAPTAPRSPSPYLASCLRNRRTSSSASNTSGSSS
jgi:hypothetical protein